MPWWGSLEAKYFVDFMVIWYLVHLGDFSAKSWPKNGQKWDGSWVNHGPIFDDSNVGRSSKVANIKGSTNELA